MAKKLGRLATYLFRGGRFNGLRMTCDLRRVPGTVILFTERSCDCDAAGDTGELYELDVDGVEYQCDEGEA